MSIVLDVRPTPDLDVSPRRAVLPWRRNALVALGCLLAVMACLAWPELFDRPISRWVSAQVGRAVAVDRVFLSFDVYFTLSGVALMACVWACWAAEEAPEHRARLLVGVGAAFSAGMLSRVAQHLVPSHPRPLYDAAVAFHPPDGLQVGALSTWNSFPSDHVTVFAGLAVVLFTVRSRLALPAAIWTALVESARLYMGVHFLSDMAGGAALAACCVWAVQGRPIVALGRRLVRLEGAAPPVFYALAFLLSFQVATLFGDVRGLLGNLPLFHGLH